MAEEWPFENSKHFLILITENGFFETIGSIFRPIADNFVFIGYTSHHEKWGLWNMNVYANQRHLALGMSLMLFGLLAMIPLMKKMYYVYEYRSLTTKERAKQFVASADAWLPDNYIRAVSLGVLFGATTFFHGSAMIALLAMLAVMGIFSKHRLEFLIIAVIVYVMSIMKSNFFAPGVEIVSPQFFFGFISPSKTIAGVANYIFMLTGIALILALLGLFIQFKRNKIFFLMFLVPFIITFTISLTPDETVNHKYLMMSMALLNIFAAFIICVLMGKLPGKLISAVLIAVMVFTGVIDMFTMQNMNGKGRSIPIPQSSEYQDWLLANTEPDDIFLTPWYSTNEIFFAGRMVYYGWPYYAWSSGYDAITRRDKFDLMVYPVNAEEGRRLVRENNISYIVIDPTMYETNDFFADPDFLKTIFPIVFEEPYRELYILKTEHSDIER
jgi:hypothetical protein